MAVDMYMRIDGVKNESTGDRHKDGIDTGTISTATVQLTENNLNQVAARLGVDKDALVLANPQIKDPSRLNVGQEIHLPPHPTPKSESVTDSQYNTIHAKDLPKAPIGDPIETSVMKAKLLGTKTG